MLAAKLLSGSPVSSVAFFGSRTSSSATIAMVDNIRAGDVAVLLDFAFTTSVTAPAPASVVPAGWTTAVDSAGTTAIRQIMAVKLLTAADVGVTLTGMNSDSERKVLAVFRPNRPATTITVGSAAGEATNGEPADQTVSSSSGRAPLIVLAGYGCNNNVVEATFSPTADATISSTSNQQLRYKIYTGSPANVTVGMSDNGRNALQSFYLSIR